MIHFVFVDELPRDLAGGWCAHYEHIPFDGSGWKQCDIRAIIASNQKRWLDEFDEWHSAVCEAALRASRWWWLMRASRPNVWAEHDSLKPLFFAVAAREWRNSHPTCAPIYLVGCPPEVKLYLSELEEDLEEVNLARSARLRTLRALLTGFVALGIQLSRLARCYSLRRPMTQSGRVLFYSHVVDGRALNEVGDHFFGDMIDTAEQAIPSEITVAYLLQNENERKRVTEYLRASNRRFCFVLDYLILWDLIWIFFTCVGANLWLARLPRALPPIRLGSRASRLFSFSYATDLILSRPPSMELAIYRAMRRLLRRSGVQTVLYPYEEKALERAILRACSEASSPVRTLAYAHAACTACHLAMRTRRAGCPTPPQPDKILATGPRARDFLVDWGRKRTTEVVVGSPRYLERCAAPRSVADRRSGLRVLVLTGHGFELSMLANFVERRTDLFVRDEVVIRRYNFGYVDAQNRAIERLSKLSDRFRVGAESLFDQIEWCDLALFSSTTAGLQAMLSGRLVAYVALHDILEADPLWGSDVCFARCCTPDQLADALARARALTDVEYARIAAMQREFATSIFAPIDKPKLMDQLWGGPKSGWWL